MDDSNNNGSSGDEGGGGGTVGNSSIRKKKVTRKKKSTTTKGKDDSRSTSSNNDNKSHGSKSSRRRKMDGSVSSSSKKDKNSKLLNLLPPKPQQQQQKSDEGSAATGGSGGSSRNQQQQQQLSSSSKKGGSSMRSRSPAPSSKKSSSSNNKSTKMNASARSWENDNTFASTAFGSFSDNNDTDFATTSSNNKNNDGDGGGDGGAFSDTFFSPSGFEENFKKSTNSNNQQQQNSTFFGGGDTAAAFQEGFGSSDFFGQQSTFDNTNNNNNMPMFDHARRDKMAKNPFKDPPQRTQTKLSLVKNTVFSQYFSNEPVTNPLNGNLIFCAPRDGEMYLQEVDPKRNFVQVMSSPILTTELHRKVTKKYSRSAVGIDNVLKLCVGIQRSHGQPRVRIVMIVDLHILDSKHILRAVPVFQWGYGMTNPVSLQYLLSPPSGTDYTYDPDTLVTADNIIFVAGSSPKGPCVFMCKPSVRESWSANFLAPSGKISTMAVITNFKRNYPYLAVGMDDGNLSVWSYAAALKQTTLKRDEPFRRLLYPLCRLEGVWVLKSIPATSLTEDKEQIADGRYSILC